MISLRLSVPVLMSYQAHILIFLLVTKIVNARQLVFANVVWRHGDRSYMESYPNDPFRNKNIWKNGFGQLTNIGMEEQFQLGKYLRSRYNGLLSSEYLRNEIYVRSTDKDRTIMSAQCNMAGLYPPTNSELWNGTNTAWQPVPVHVVPVDDEQLLRFPDRDCPAYTKIVNTIRHSPWYLKHEKDYSKFYEFIQNKTGLTEPPNLTTIWAIEDNLFCLKSNNYSLPSWATPDVMSKLKHLNSLEMGLMFTDIDKEHRKAISKMQGGVLLKQIVQNMTDHIAKITSVGTSVIAYSAHDTTLTALLVALNNYDWIQPTYASCIMLELYKDGDNYSVEVLYRKGDGTVTVLKLDACETNCPFEEFLRISSELIPDDHDKICGKLDPVPPTPCNSFLLVIVAVLFFLNILSLGICVVFKKRDKGTEYSMIRSEEEVGIA